MPLHEWIETDVARELAHEASTLQILGLTNYSVWPRHAPLRRCYFEDDAVRAALDALAEARLRAMAHVGLTERLEDSVAAMVADLGHRMNDVAYKVTTHKSFSYDGPEYDPEAEVVVNTTLDGPAGALHTMSVSTARLGLARLTGELTGIDAQLKRLEPKLQELVDQEEEWLAAEEARGPAAAAAKRAVGWLKSVVTVAKGGAKGGAEPPRINRTAGAIDSPLAAEIEALDDRVFSYQERRGVVKHNIQVLMALPGVPPVPPTANRGRAHLILPDDEHLEKFPLGATYLNCSVVRRGGGGCCGHRRTGHTCRRFFYCYLHVPHCASTPSTPSPPSGAAQSAKTKAAEKRQKAFRHLVTPWEETFGFSSAARKKVPALVRARILELNGADQALWDVGQQLLERRLAELLVAGRLEELPKPGTAAAAALEAAMAAKPKPPKHEPGTPAAQEPKKKKKKKKKKALDDGAAGLREDVSRDEL
jgi:hypothetical protein